MVFSANTLTRFSTQSPPPLVGGGGEGGDMMEPSILFTPTLTLPLTGEGKILLIISQDFYEIRPGADGPYPLQGIFI